MVKPESYDLAKGPLPNGIIESKTQLLTAKLERAAHGGWFLNATVNAEFSMKDGRKVLISKAVRLKGAQEGSRPNPNPFGRKRKKVEKDGD